MPKDWTKTAAFEQFGTKLTNPQWSWSGIAEDGSTVAIVLWQDKVKGKSGKLIYADDEELDAEWRKRTGNKERIRHLAHAEDALDGHFRAVIARAKDVEVDPRQIMSCRPYADVWWRLDFLDRETGAFRAHILEA